MPCLTITLRVHPMHAHYKCKGLDDGSRSVWEICLEKYYRYRVVGKFSWGAIFSGNADRCSERNRHFFFILAGMRSPNVNCTSILTFELAVFDFSGIYTCMSRLPKTAKICTICLKFPAMYGIYRQLLADLCRSYCRLL